jgi:DNA-binding NarL/FixJ family response regulator
MSDQVEAPKARPRILIVDDHELFRGGLREILEEDGFAVVGEAPDGESAARLAAELAPDVVVMDLHMPGISGVEATRRIHDTMPATRVLMLTVSDSEDDVSAAVLAGASGYLIKDAGPEQIVAGARAAAAGEALLSPRVAADLLAGLRREDARGSGPESAPRITDREQEVLRLMAAGKNNTEIAEELFISIQTVKNHVSNLLEKLQVENRVQASVYAVRKRLI